MASQSDTDLSAPLRVELFGPLRVLRLSHTVRLATRKVESLLAYLVLHPEAHAREKLAALLWGDVSDLQARGSLRKALTLLRASLGDDILRADRQSVQLNPDVPLKVDTREFDAVTAVREWGTMERLRETSVTLDGLYEGELLSDLYDDWVLPLRKEYENRYIETLLALTLGYRAQSEYGEAIKSADRVLEVEPANERAHQHLMFCFVGIGNRHAALEQYAECVRVLEHELGVEPSADTVALFQWIQHYSGQGAAREALATNLPLPLSSFVGRERETTEIKEYMRPPVRLVTLTGPGGSGKTRLAIQTATDVICSGANASAAGYAYPDGVWWVELAAIADPANLFQQIAKTLGVRASPQEPLSTTLTTFLERKRLLLILDNCEHVLGAAAEAAKDLLEHSAGLTILATSREAMRIAGEQVYPVPTLRVPRRDAWTYVELLREFEGIRLFVERAQAVRPTFGLDESNAAAVAQICARLDGIPLALELAASRIKVLAPQEIAARLDARFDLLKDANRAAPPRHQTLRAVLDWSCELLSPDERLFFRRLATFAGGCTLDAVEAVMTELEAVVVLDTLTHLVDKSLVTVTTQGTATRYSMLETIREYALEMLKDSGENELIRSRHLEQVRNMTNRAERALRGEKQMEWLERLDAELDNIRAALEWSLNTNPEMGLEVAGSLEWFWNLRGHWNEGASWLDRLLAADDVPQSSPAVARGLVAASNLICWGEQDFNTARACLERAIGVYEAQPITDWWYVGYAYSLLGASLDNLHEQDAAHMALDMSLVIAKRIGPEGKWVAAWAYLFLGWVDSEPERAREHMETSVSLFRELHDSIQLPVALAHFAWYCIKVRDLEAAQRYADEGMALTVEINDTLGIGWYHKLFGDLAQRQRDPAAAARYYQAALDQFQRLGNRAGMDEVRASLEWMKENQGP